MFPNIKDLSQKTSQELKNLKITKIESGFPNIWAIGMSLSDGTSCKAGTNNYNNCFNIDATKHISKIETIMTKDEKWIG